MPKWVKFRSFAAAKTAFKPKEEKTTSQKILEKPHVDKELSPMEMSVICSNLARGCEKQYLPQQADDFRKLAEFFRSKAVPVEEASTARLLELIEQDLSVGYPYGNAVAGEKPDRGGLRCQVWSEKVTRMLQSHTHGNAFLLYADTLAAQHAINIACRMACS